MRITNQANLTNSIRQLNNNGNPTDTHSGWLGNGQGVVLVPNSTNGTEVYVRILGQSGVKIAFNAVAPNVDNLPVIIGYFPTSPSKLQVIRQKEYSPAQNVASVPSLGTHHQQHEYGGSDVVFISKRQYLPFRLSAYGFLVIVSPDYVYTNGGWNLYYPTGPTDLSGLVPTSGSRYMLASVSQDGASTDFTTGSVSMALALTDIPVLPYGDAPVAAVKLYNGQTFINEYTDILDLRGNPFIGISGSFGTGTGSYGDMYRSVYDPNHDGIVSNAENADTLDGHHWSEITGSSGGGGHIIEKNGSPFTQRTNLNFVGAGVAVSDDPGNDATIVTIATGTSGGGSSLAVQAYNSVDQNGGNGSYTYLTFDTEIFNSGGMFSSGNPTRLTCTEAGLYLVNFVVDVEQSTYGSSFVFRKNGTTFVAAQNSAVVGASFTTIAALVKLSVSDYLEIGASTGGGAVYTNSYSPFFGMAKVG